MACGADAARGANVARGTRAGATRHARPRGRAARAHAVHGGTDAWHGPCDSMRCTVAPTRGIGHATPRGCPGGTTWQGG